MGRTDASGFGEGRLLDATRGRKSTPAAWCRGASFLRDGSLLGGRTTSPLTFVRVGYRADTRLDLAELAPQPIALRVRTVNRYLPARSVILSDLWLAGFTAETVLLLTVPLALRRMAVTT